MLYICNLMFIYTYIHGSIFYLVLYRKCALQESLYVIYNARMKIKNVTITYIAIVLDIRTQTE